MIRLTKRPPDFRQLLKVLHKEVPDRPVLFELFVCDEVLEAVTGKKLVNAGKFEKDQAIIKTYEALGYDYALVMPSAFEFKAKPRAAKASVSINEGAIITDRESFDAYEWPSAADYDYSHMERLAAGKPENMGLLVWSADGPLESVIKLAGYENLCYMLYDDEYLFPWHREIVRMAHESGRPAILHSCGRYDGVIEDIINDMGYDARHSYEDNIVPVEKAYGQLFPRLAVLGGIDMNFLATATKEEIARRSKNMLEMTAQSGGYALGSGNSIPSYVPLENYMTMIKTALDHE